MDLERINRYALRVTKQRNTVVSFDRADYEDLLAVADELSLNVSVLVRGVVLTFLEDYLSSADQKEVQ